MFFWKNRSRSTDADRHEIPREELERRIAVLRARVERLVGERAVLTEQLSGARAQTEVAPAAPPVSAPRRGRKSSRAKPAPEKAPVRSLPQKKRAQVDAAEADRRAMLQELLRGGSFLEAAVAYVRTTLGDPARIQGRAFAQGLLDDPATSGIGRLCCGIQAHADGLYELSRHFLAQVDPVSRDRHAAADWIECLLLQSIETGREAARDWLRDRPTPRDPVEARQMYALSQKLAGLQQLDLAEQASQQLQTAADLLEPSERTRLDWQIEHLARRREARAGSEPAPGVGHVRFGVLDYKLLDYGKTSPNIGDHVQTLASLSNLVRFSGLRFSSTEPGLASWVSGLQQRVQPRYRIEGPQAQVDLTLVDRDLSSSRRYAAPTWLLAFGWYMHANFKHYFDFPFEPNLRPIFISFHVNNRSMLSDAATQYLRRYEPIGCRDWTTVYILRDAGVKAFFSGCLTSTVGKVFPETVRGADRGVAQVDYRPRPQEFGERTVTRFTQAYEQVRKKSFCENMDDAVALLEGYRAFDTIATSRLHCYLPCTSLGLDVIFKPRNLSDVRFEGLVELGTDGFQRIRDGIEHKLARVLERIVAGDAEEDVYRLWRELCAEDLAAADRYCRGDVDLGRAPPDVLAPLEAVRASALHLGQASSTGAMHVAFVADSTSLDALVVAIESLLAQTKEVVHLHLVTRGWQPPHSDRIVRAFGGLARLSLYAMDGVHYGRGTGAAEKAVVSAIDRMVLPELLPDLDRLVVLEADVVVRADIAPLWQLDLGSAVVAAKSTAFATLRHGHNLVYRVAEGLPHHKSWRLRRALHAQGTLNFRAFSRGVLVLDLQRMRQEEFCARSLPLVLSYGMDDQDALNLYARERRLDLGAEWNAVPSQDVTEGARIVRFAAPLKPWVVETSICAEDFAAWRERHQHRTAAVPA